MRHAILKSILSATMIFSASAFAGGPTAETGPRDVITPSGNPFTIPDVSTSVNPSALNCQPIVILIVEHIGGEKHFIYSTIRNPRC